MRSLLQRKEDGQCYLCLHLMDDASRKGTVEHHIYEGTGRRKLSEQYGMKAEDLKKYIEVAVVKEQIIRSKVIAVVVDNATAIKTEAKKKSKKDEETEEGAAE